MSTRIRIGKQTELSSAVGSLVNTDLSNEQEYLVPGALGDVLTSNGPGAIPSYQAPASSGFASGFQAYKEVPNQAVAFSTATIVTGYTEVYDGLGEFDPVTGIFTPTVTGAYLALAYVDLDPAANTTGLYSVWIEHSGPNIDYFKQRFFYSLTVASHNIMTGGIIQMVAGTNIRVKVDVQAGTAGGTSIQSGVQKTGFSVQRIR